MENRPKLKVAEEDVGTIIWSAAGEIVKLAMSAVTVLGEAGEKLLNIFLYGEVPPPPPVP